MQNQYVSRHQKQQRPVTGKVTMSPIEERGDMSSHKKKRSENTVFAHDHLRFWETVYNQRLRCDT
jgi:hypothetical protein